MYFYFISIPLDTNLSIRNMFSTSKMPGINVFNGRVWLRPLPCGILFADKRPVGVRTIVRVVGEKR